MVVIIEYNGASSDGIMGLVLDRDGNTRTWESVKEAERWAKKNCAFNYKVVEL